MKDRELLDMLLRLEARITQLENHCHSIGKEVTSKPKILVESKGVEP